MLNWLFPPKKSYKVSFEDIQTIIYKKNFLLINTLKPEKQKCLIKNTISITQEVKVINKNMNNINISLIIYGENSNDPTIIKKWEQLQTLGFKNVYIYMGGLFEWLCLQDIYGEDAFPTIGSELDILKYRPKSILGKSAHN